MWTKKACAIVVLLITLAGCAQQPADSKVMERAQSQISQEEESSPDISAEQPLQSGSQSEESLSGIAVEQSTQSIPPSAASSSSDAVEDEYILPEAPAFIWPVDNNGVINQIMYYPILGSDMPAKAGTDIYAAADGTISSVEITEPAAPNIIGYGHYIKIDHVNGYQTLYAHCDSLLVEVGDEVKAGQVIATVGRSGNKIRDELRFEVYCDGHQLNAKNYVSYSSTDD